MKSPPMAASDGYPHWSFGMAYEERAKHDWGLSKIHEMVINNDRATPTSCSNHDVDQKLV